jgi:hypothetical protein
MDWASLIVMLLTGRGALIGTSEHEYTRIILMVRSLTAFWLLLPQTVVGGNMSLTTRTKYSKSLYKPFQKIQRFEPVPAKGKNDI